MTTEEQKIFMNGYVIGKSTKGLISADTSYSPRLWNDEGVYTYFYIDFKKDVEEFSLGMLSESIIVYDSIEIAIEKFENVSTGVYKFFANIRNKISGVTVINKESSWLYFKDGSKIPAFSALFYVSGLAAQLKMKYIYETIEFKTNQTKETVVSVDLSGTFRMNTVYDSAMYKIRNKSCVEMVSVCLT